MPLSGTGPQSSEATDCPAGLRATDSEGLRSPRAGRAGWESRADSPLRDVTAARRRIGFTVQLRQRVLLQALVRSGMSETDLLVLMRRRYAANEVCIKATGQCWAQQPCELRIAVRDVPVVVNERGYDSAQREERLVD